MSFDSLTLKPWICAQLRTVGISRMTEVQAAALPAALAGESLLISSRTGTGKTLVYLLPVLQALSVDPVSVAAVVLVPSRELAMHVATQFEAFGRGVGLRCAVVTGGQSYSRQQAALAGCPHVLVGTPGKMAETLTTDAAIIRLLPNVRLLVLDEADQLLDPTLIDFSTKVIKALPQNAQRILSSATFEESALAPERLVALLGPSASALRVLNLNKAVEVAAALGHYYLFVPELLKDYYFLHVVRVEAARAEADRLGYSLIVFFNSCRDCHFWYKLLRAFGVSCTQVHSFIRQESRARNLAAFQSGQHAVLLSTDLGARGLDVRSVRLVICYDFPPTHVDYVHRVGRTARGGERGTALSIVTPRETAALREVETRIGVRMREFWTESEEIVLEKMAKFDKLKRKLKIHFLVKGVDKKFAQIRKRKREFRIENIGKTLKAKTQN